MTFSRPPHSFFSGGTVIVPVGATVPYNCTGQLFICKEADGIFKMSMNDGAFFPMEVGLGIRLNGTDQFTKLTFQNDTASIITIQFYTGVGEIVDNRLNTVIDRLVVVGLKDIPDYSKGLGTIASLPFITYSLPKTVLGTDGGKQRKQIAVTNLDGTNPIYVTDASDLLLSVIAPGQTWTMMSSATFKLQTSTSGLYYALYQTFYNS